MGTTLTSFVTNDDIRAVLGVSPEELEDQVLAVPIYLRQLQFDFYDISPTLESTYLSIAATSAGSRTGDQQKLYDVLQTYAAYFIARVLLTSLPLFSPKRITDGKAEIERVVDPYMEVREGVDAGYGSLRERLIGAFNTLGNSIAIASRTFPYSVSAGLATDPVTGT